MEDMKNAALDWDQEITLDEQEYLIVPEGDFPFIVTKAERGRFPGSEKMCACNKMIVTMHVKLPDGKMASVRMDLIMHKLMEWKISAFFRCIGQKKKGEALKPDWSRVTGSRGFAHFKPRKYKNKMNEERETSDIDRFYDYDEAHFMKDDPYTWGYGDKDGFVGVDDDTIPF